jgi:hypothetical protein
MPKPVSKKFHRFFFLGRKERACFSFFVRFSEGSVFGLGPPDRGRGVCRDSEVPTGADLSQGVADAVVAKHAEHAGLLMGVAAVQACFPDICYCSGQFGDQVGEAGHGVFPLGTPIA